MSRNLTADAGPYLAGRWTASRSRSAIVGTPSVLVPPPALEISTARTGGGK